MKQSDIASPDLMSRARVTELCVKLLSRARVTELRVKLLSRARVTELRVKLLSRARLSETSLVVNDQSKGDLERSSRDQTRQYFASRPQNFQWSTTRTEQGSGLLTIPVLVEGGSFGLAKQHLPWTSHLLNN